MEGWIKIHRQIKDHWIWKSQNRFQWWIDILLSVNHTDTKVLIKGNLIECKRGQSVRSLETWAKDWNVTKKTVKEFFELLQNDSMLLYESIQISTRITVCNYDNYQTEVNAKETKGKRKVNGTETVTTPKQEYKEGKEYITPEQKSFNFYSEQVLIAKQYTDQMSQDYVKFCNHICQKKDGDFRLPYVLKINNQITIDEFSKLYLKSGNKLDVILTKIDSLQTNVKYHGKYTDLYLTINKWLNG